MKTTRNFSETEERIPTQQAPRTKCLKKYLFWVLLVIVCVFFGKAWWQREASSEATAPVSENQNGTPAEIETASKPGEYVEYTVKEGDIPADIFATEAQYDANDVEVLLQASEGVYDLTNLTIGKKMRLYFEDTGAKERASRVEYYKDTESVIVVVREGDAFRVTQEPIQYEVTTQVAKGVIDDFFYVDALEAGLQEATILDVGDIFSSAIDFTTEIQKDDSFAFVYEERKREGVRQSDGKILAAKFVNAGETYFAYYFEQNGEGQYYDQEGHVIQRQFLKAPLTYRYISSGFTGARMHPITKTVHAHYQIDYAAPTGTPVVATANGTVVSARFEGGWGNIVRLSHQNGYTTHYAHLSGYAKGLASGAQVKQGQIVGYVGSTGWSTGPHLDYGMKLNGAPLNPLELKQPKGEKLPDDALGAFEAVKEEYKASLE